MFALTTEFVVNDVPNNHLNPFHFAQVFSKTFFPFKIFSLE